MNVPRELVLGRSKATQLGKHQHANTNFRGAKKRLRLGDGVYWKPPIRFRLLSTPCFHQRGPAVCVGINSCGSQRSRITSVGLRSASPRCIQKNTSELARASMDASQEATLEQMLRNLPIGEVVDQIVSSLETRPNLVVEAAPGAGKTTCLPLALLQRSTWLESGQRILVLEPRRLAARAAAARMAASLGEAVGQTVGYRVRLEAKVSRDTRIQVVTDGILLRRLQADPALEGVAAVLLDEFHERSVEVDTALTLCREVQSLLRPELRIVVMSATLGSSLAATLTGLLGDKGGPPAALVSSAGRSFPLTLKYVDPPGTGEMERCAARTVRAALEQTRGDVLCFLPGAGEIRAVESLLAGLPQCAVLPLHGSLSVEMQDAALKRTPGDDTRRVILASPVAESSLTIPGVRVVVDSGLCRSPRFDPSSGLTRLHLSPISQASATQRAGRAAREGPGSCYRMWSQSSHNQRPESPLPEIASADLTSTVLDLVIWGVQLSDISELGWVDAPTLDQQEYAVEVLQGLGALTNDGLPTSRGRQLASFPLHPRLAHLVIRGWELGFGKLACQIAALLEERDILRGRMPGSDLRIRVDALNEVGQYANDKDRGTCQRIGQQVDRLLNTVQSLVSSIGSEGAKVSSALDGLTADDAVGLLLACAYPDRIAQRRERGSGGSGSATAFLLSSGRGVTFPQSSKDPLSNQAYLVVAEVGAAGKMVGGRGWRGGRGPAGSMRNELVFLAAPVDINYLTMVVPDLITQEESVFWADGKKAVLARQSTRLGSLVLQETPLDNPSVELVETCLMDAVRRLGVKNMLRWTPAALSWQQRVNWVRSQPTAPELPDMSDHALVASLDDWLLPMIAGGEVRSKGQLAQLDLLSILKNQLSWADQQLVEEWAPQKITIPSGRQVALDFESEIPMIEVKLQEMFGASEGPMLAGGTIPVQMRLMSPALRPAAVTQDLANFWEKGYPDVRKELKGRYPKHAWPEDPLTASPPKGGNTLKPKSNPPTKGVGKGTGSGKKKR